MLMRCARNWGDDMYKRIETLAKPCNCGNREVEVTYTENYDDLISITCSKCGKIRRSFEYRVSAQCHAAQCDLSSLTSKGESKFYKRFKEVELSIDESGLKQIVNLIELLKKENPCLRKKEIKIKFMRLGLNRISKNRFEVKRMLYDTIYYEWERPNLRDDEIAVYPSDFGRGERYSVEKKIVRKNFKKIKIQRHDINDNRLIRV